LANVTAFVFKTNLPEIRTKGNLKPLKSSKDFIWDDSVLAPLFDNNRAFREKKLQKNPEHFANLAKGQAPQFLYIGCADSRVPAQEMMGLDDGQLFVHRNIANMVINTDLSMLSVVQYAVEYLGVQDIIICGHYKCGGVKAAMEDNEYGLIDHWLRSIRDVARLHSDELNQIRDPELRHQRLIELNVQEQCLNVYHNSIVQDAIRKKGGPRIHGLVYDLENGLLKKLNVNFARETSKVADIYDINTYKSPSPEKKTEEANDALATPVKKGFISRLKQRVFRRRGTASFFFLKYW